MRPCGVDGEMFAYWNHAPRKLNIYSELAILPPFLLSPCSYLFFINRKIEINSPLPSFSLRSFLPYYVLRFFPSQYTFILFSVSLPGWADHIIYHFNQDIFGRKRGTIQSGTRTIGLRWGPRTCGHGDCTGYLPVGSHIPSLTFFAPSPSALTPPNYISQTALPTLGTGGARGRGWGSSLCPPLKILLTPPPPLVPPALLLGRATILR